MKKKLRVAVMSMSIAVLSKAVLAIETGPPAGSGVNAAVVGTSAPDAGVDGGTTAGDGPPAAEGGAAPAPIPPAEPRAPAQAARPLKGDQGRIEGTVIDAKTGEPLIEAQVTLMGTKKKVLTDLDGNYRMTVPAGVHEIRVWAELKAARRISKIEVEKGKTTRIDVALGGDDKATLKEVVVVAAPDTATEAVQMVRRQKASTVSDGVSAEQIARTPDTSASDAVKRVVAATVQDGKYVVVRGLGGRYSSTLLNGVTLPSPDPDVPAAPLDLFPASLLANLNVVKTFTPDIPGNFAGGSLQIETRDFPSKFTLKLRFAGSGDTTTTFRPTQTPPGGSLDVLGYDDGSRALPAAIPRDRPLRTDSGFTRDEINGASRSFANRWILASQKPKPNFGFGATVGDTLNRGNGRFGYLASVSYGHKWTRRISDLRRTDFTNPPEHLKADFGQETATLGGLLNLGFTPSSAHRFNLISLYTHTGDSSAQKVTGVLLNSSNESELYRIRFLERGMAFSQLVGEHALGRRLSLAWQGNIAVTQQREPDTRDLIRYLNPDHGFLIALNQQGSGERSFTFLQDVAGGGGTDLTVPFDTFKLKAGGAATLASRNLSARRFRFKPAHPGPLDPALAMLPPDQLFSAEHIGPDITLDEETITEDGFRGTRNIYAAYLMADVTRLDPLRLVAGFRYEHAYQQLIVGTRYAGSMPPGSRSDDEVLPAAALIYTLPNAANIRASYSTTLARPQFRELAQLKFFDYARSRVIEGNRNLLTTTIQNVDLRFEHFVTSSEVVAASAFYKRFNLPIETVVRDQGGDVTWENSPGADLVGGELEGRLSLERLSRGLRGMYAGANLALIYSQIRLDPAKLAQTNSKRPLQGQSPYVINVDVGYRRDRSGTDLNVLYNVFGRRIAEVGLAPLPDVYERPFHRVDVTVSQRLPQELVLKLSAVNVLARRVSFQQGGFEVVGYQPGSAFLGSIEWTFNNGKER
jgi:hypothetical protein